MADNGDKRTFPRLPTRNWWDLRERFKRTMPSRVDTDYLQSVLGLTSAGSAKTLLGPLRTLGLIDAEGRPTDRALTWREDESYKQVCEDILTDVYPDNLRSAFPDPSGNLTSVTSWFSRNTGTGQRAASSMAALYMLISERDPEAGQTNASTTTTREKKVTAKKAAKKATTGLKPKNGGETGADATKDRRRRTEPELNINVQIHISSDASADQIDQIFKSMAEHLYGDK